MTINRLKHILLDHILSKDCIFWLANYSLRPLRSRWRVSDKTYLKVLFRCSMGEKLDLVNPLTFNQKLQWLKLYDRDPQYTNLVDKYMVKKVVANIIGEQYIIPTLGVYNRFEEIDFNTLPDKFVLKTTNGSGNTGVIIVQDKTVLDKEKAKRRLQSSMQEDCYNTLVEWPYHNIPPKIIAETFMTDESSEDLKDYKFLCFNGKVRCSFVCTGRNSSSGLKVTFYDRDWNIMPFERNHLRETSPIPKPTCYNEMVHLAEHLSRNLTFARIDLYEINGRPYFGEITFYPGSGLEPFSPKEWDKILGDWLVLPQTKR